MTSITKVVVFLAMTLAVFEACNGSCNLNVQKLKICEDAVAISQPSDPSSECCNMIKGLSDYEINCLCEYKRDDSFLLYTLGVDAKRCTELPGLCKLPNAINC